MMEPSSIEERQTHGNSPVPPQPANPRVNFSDVIHDHREVGSGLFPVAGAGGGGTGDHDGSGGGCGLPVPPGCMGSRRAPYRYSLTYFQRVVGGSGHILNDLCASLWFTYFLLYMQKVAGFTDRYFNLYKSI